MAFTEKEQFNKQVIDRIRGIRKQNRLTQTAFGKIIGLSRTAYSQVEIHNSVPSLHVIKLISEHFDISYSYLIYGVESVPITDKKTMNKIAKLASGIIELTKD